MFPIPFKFVFAVTFWCLLSNSAHACDWAPPNGNTSQWVEDKVVFWGRALETKWNKSNESGWHEYDTYTDIEVIEEVKGDLHKKIRVYHSMNPAGCGVYFQLGSIELFVLPQQESKGRFKTGSHIRDAVSQLILSAYYLEGMNLPLDEARLFERRSFDNPCQTPRLSNGSNPDYCKWEDVFIQAKRSYINKTELLQKTANKKWWQ